MNLLQALITKHNIPEIKPNFFLFNREDIVSDSNNQENDTTPIDFQALFGNNKPVIMEIGCGRGELLAKLSKLYPDTNFLGVELSAKRIITMLKIFDPEKNSNIRLHEAKVDENYLKIIPPKSLEKVIILHPDPWPKRKHHKNRLINNDFITALAKIVKEEVLVSTDDEQYAMHIVKCFSENDLYRSAYEKGYNRESFWDNIETHFERKMKKAGYTPFYIREFLVE